MRINKHKERNSAIWFTVYADMMTNLMLFFLAAFALSRTEKAFQQKASDTLKNEFAGNIKKTVVSDSRVQEKHEVNAAAASVGRYSQVEINEKRIKISLSEEVLFSSGSSELSEEMKSALHRVAGILKVSQNRVIVEGYTDDVQIRSGTNWELSLARAVSVVEYFVKTENLERPRFMAAGYGEYKPLVPNNSEENRRKNRRIDITLVRYE